MTLADVRRGLAAAWRVPRATLFLWLGVGVCAIALGWTAGLAQAAPGEANSAEVRLEDALDRAREAQGAGRYAEAADAYSQAIALGAHSAELWSNRGVMEHLAGRYAPSVDSLERAIRLKPSLPAPYLFLGLDELELNSPAQAARYLERGRTLSPADAQVASALGRAYTALHRPRPAAAAYTAATALDANNSAAWYGLGTASIAVIEQDGRALASGHANSGWAQALFADALLQQGRTKEAIEAYRTAAATMTPADRSVLAETLRHTREAAAAGGSGSISPEAWDSVSAVLRGSTETAALPACPSMPTSPSGRRPAQAGTAHGAASGQQMACLYWQDQYARCAEAAGEQLARAPDDTEALFWSVKANERRAVESLARFEQLAPQSAATFDLLGDLDRRRMEPDSALAEYAKALAIAPRDAGALLGRAAALLATGRMDEASRAAEDALADAPGDPRLNLILAEALIERHHDAEAEPHVKTALSSIAATGAADASVAALAPRAHALLGRIKAEEGDLDGAVAELNLGLSSDQDGSLSFQLSRLYRRLGRPVEASRAEANAKALQAQRREHARIAVQASEETKPE